ncbi:MAG: molybdopterin molybdotransferase MoeA [Rhodobacteraceae bacterium]|nr:molybdopterin molybdotransferase MoeA [Paracoccaceae bacterium]
MISVREATDRIRNLLVQKDSEEIPINRANNRILAEDFHSERNQPPFDISAMDGYAIQSKDAIPNKVLKVIGAIPAGANIPPVAVGHGEAYRIFTGAPVPHGADRVIIQEDVEVSGTTIRINDSFESNPFIRPLGGDFQKGFSIKAPQPLKPGLISLLAAMNAGTLKVIKKPVVSIIPTGDELMMPGTVVPDNKIVASNIFGLQGILENSGAEARIMPIAKDNFQTISTSLNLALDSDLVITVGGASVGEHDLVKEAASGLGFELSFYKIAMRPGKPLFAGKKGSTVLIGLPGNPVSALVCGYIFLIPAIKHMMGLTDFVNPRKKARLTTPLGKNSDREHYMRSIVEFTNGEATISAHERQDSSLLKTFFNSNALLVRPRSDHPRQAGELVEYMELH